MGTVKADAKALNKQTNKQLQKQNNVTMDVTWYRDNTMMDVSRPSEMKGVDHTIMDNVTRPFNFHDNNQTANITSSQQLLFYKVKFPFLEADF